MNEFKRDEDDEDIKIMNFDDELKKIISESLTKVQGACMSNSVINPLLDVKKKELNQNPPAGRMRLFTKNGNKIVITEVKKGGNEEEEEEEDEDNYRDFEDDEDDD